MADVRKATRALPSLTIEAGDYVLRRDGVAWLVRALPDVTAVALACELGALEVLEASELLRAGFPPGLH
jgi:hypothetical protein